MAKNKSPRQIAVKTVKIVLIILVFLLISNLIATKFIYDAIFPRYDKPAELSETALALKNSNRAELVTFDSGKNKLTGYLYNNDSDTLIVIATGLNSTTDDYLCQISDLLDYGWAVFSFDATGCGASEGRSQYGFPQIAWDLDCALNYLESENNFGYAQIVLMGHSRGAYAVCCELNKGHDISAVVSVSGISTCMDGIMGVSTGVMGPAAFANYPFLWFYQVCIFDAETIRQDAVSIINGSDVPVLVIQGETDKDFGPDAFSLYSDRAQITSADVAYLLCTQTGHSGHTDLLFDDDGTANDTVMQTIHAFIEDSVN